MIHVEDHVRTKNLNNDAQKIVEVDKDKIIQSIKP